MSLRHAALVSAIAIFALGFAGCRADASSQGASRLVRLADGRAIHFECRGSGAPTVLFESGYGARSDAWAQVQSQVARETRACAYDRAGYGASDPGPEPRDGAAVARDLDEAVDLAGLKPPFVLVGHSAGGLYVRLFAARRPSDVAGLLLVDPTVAHEAAPPNDGLEGMRAEAAACADRLRPAAVREPGGPAPCEGPRDPRAWLNRVSELQTLFGATSAQVFRADTILRDIPRYVLTASQTAEGSPLVSEDPIPLHQLDMIHRETAAQALVGYQRTVRSSHLIMIDRPEVVVAATAALVQAARRHEPPPPLPPSELPR